MKRILGALLAATLVVGIKPPEARAVALTNLKLEAVFLRSDGFDVLIVNNGTTRTPICKLALYFDRGLPILKDVPCLVAGQQIKVTMKYTRGPHGYAHFKVDWKNQIAKALELDNRMTVNWNE